MERKYKALRIGPYDVRNTRGQGDVYTEEWRSRNDHDWGDGPYGNDKRK